MNDIKQIIENTESKGLNIVQYISRHRTVIIILVASSAIILAVFQAQSYLNPERNEEKYTEIRSSISTKEIDEEILSKLKETLSDAENTADLNLAQDRTNPFAE
jgi:Tfp pilus assembly protein PilO